MTAGSFLPAGTKRAIGTQSGSTSVREEPGAVHRIFHFASFGFAAFLGSLPGSSRTRRLLTCVGVAALGIGIEFSQLALNRTVLEWWDIRDDLLAVAVAALVAEAGIIRRTLVRD